MPHESVQKLVHKLSHQRDIKIDYRKIPGADHLYADHTELLASHVEAYVTEHLRPAGAEPVRAAARGR